MSELTPQAEQALANMSEFEVTELLAKVRPAAESQDPMERAAQALRRAQGLDRTVTGATKEDAAKAVRQSRSRTTDGRGTTKEGAAAALRQFRSNGR